MCTKLLTKTLPVIAVVMCLASAAAPTFAQQYLGPRHQEIGTVGDLPAFLLKPGIKSTGLSLDFGPTGLFRDADVYDFKLPDPFIFPLPGFAERGVDFTGKTFEEYLTYVANSYDLVDYIDYLFRFQVQNSVTAEFPDFIPSLDQVYSVHQQDFLAGGGYLPLPGEPTIPGEPYVELPDPTLPDITLPEPPFDPLDDPTIPGASAIADEVTSSASQQMAAAVSVVPEPATLGLIALGAAGCLIRRR